MFQTPEMSVGRYLEKINNEQAVVESVAVLINAERKLFDNCIWRLKLKLYKIYEMSPTSWREELQNCSKA